MRPGPRFETSGLQFPREYGITQQRAAPWGGDNPDPLESLGARYYMGNTKIATMFASHETLGKRRSVALGDWASWSEWRLFGCKQRKQWGALWGEPSLMCT
jgi:hypothetical protein